MISHFRLTKGGLIGFLTSTPKYIDRGFGGCQSSYFCFAARKAMRECLLSRNRSVIIFLAVFNVPEKSVARAAIILGEIAMMVILMSLFGHHWSVTNMVAPFFNAWLVLTIALVTFVSLMSHRSGFGLCRRQRNVEQTGSNRPAETVV